MSRLSDVPLGVMFHRFVPEGRVSAQGALTPSRLRSILEDLRGSGVIDASEWMERLASGSLAGHRCLTFDDGLRSQLDLALPVLEDVDIRAFWFIPTGVFGDARPVAELLAHALDESDDVDVMLRSFCDIAEGLVGAPPDASGLSAYRLQAQRRFPFYSDLDCEYRYVRNSLTPEVLERTVEQVLETHGFERSDLDARIFVGAVDVQRLVAAGQTIGLHSHTQPFDIASLPVEQQHREYERNLQDLERTTGVRSESVAHPLGSYGPETLTLLEELGIVCGFRSDALSGVGLTPGAGPLEFARIDAAAL